MEYSYDDYKGQRRINGELCRVDWKLVKALNEIYKILEAAHPPVKQELLTSLRQAIDDANLTSSKVASIKPPGCEPENRENGEDPTYTPPAITSPQPNV